MPTAGRATGGRQFDRTRGLGDSGTRGLGVRGGRAEPGRGLSTAEEELRVHRVSAAEGGPQAPAEHRSTSASEQTTEAGARPT